MSRAACVALVTAACVLGPSAAFAEPAPDPDGAPAHIEADAARAFREAIAAGDIAALEQLGAARPSTRWTDDAWAEAARLAVRANDFARARRALDQVIANGTDPQLIRRARLELARLDAIAGTGGEWTDVARAHERLVARLHAGGDPRPVLGELEQLARAHPDYPRAAMLVVAIASGWEREGEAARALVWLREARTRARAPTNRVRAHAELVRTLTRTGELATAARELADLAKTAPPGLVANLERDLSRAGLRRNLRHAMWCLLAVLTVVSAVALRRSAGSWRVALRRLVRPPVEAIFLLPLASLLVIVAYTGNPLIARAVRTIAIAGIAANWVSGAILDGRRGRLGIRRVLVHIALCVLAVGAATYLAVDRGYVIDFVIETWRSGHELDY